MLLLILVIVLIILLVTIYLLGIVTRSKSLNETFHILLLNDPLTRAFTLGKSKTYPDKFTNCFMDDKTGNIYTLDEDAPIDLRGRHIVLNNDHGRIIDVPTGGYQITGIDLTTFSCPDGYVGATCEPRALCEPHIDDNKLKPLTISQFNQLNLYKNVFPLNADTALTNAQVMNHPRLRVQCLTDGKYKLEACPENELLDNNLQCNIYDICQDKMTGYKHNYPINNHELSSDEYYICRNSVSVLTKCADHTIFNKANNGCIADDVCKGRDSQQIAVDTTHYIQCNDDRTQTIHCVNGIVTDASTGLMSCKTKNCKPHKFIKENALLRYTYGEIKCDENDNESTILCNVKDTMHTQPYEWGSKFTFDFKTWPSEVLNQTGTACTKDIETDGQFSIRDDARTKFRWSNAMYGSHYFNPKTSQFYCDTTYRWDYLNNKLIPEPESKLLFIDSASPCPEAVIPSIATLWLGIDNIVHFPQNKIPIIYGAPVGSASFEENEDATQYLWPRYIKSKQVYIGTTMSYDLESRTFLVSTFSDTLPPIGFVPIDDDIATSESIALTLHGYESFHKDNNIILSTYNWYFIASGTTATMKFSPKASLIKQIILKAPKRINTASIGDGTTERFAIIWSHIVTSIVVSKNQFEIHPNGVYIANTLLPATFEPLLITGSSKNAPKFMYGHRVIELSDNVSFDLP